MRTNTDVPIAKSVVDPEGMSLRVVLLLPAFNEAQTIADTILDFHRELPRTRIIVIDNNSSDATAEIARETFEKHRCNGTVMHEKRQGKGNAVRSAFAQIDADIYIMADADLTYPAKDIHALLVPVLEQEADIAVGNRHANGRYKEQNKRSFHNFGNNLVTKSINTIFACDLKDIMSGYRVFSRQFVKNYPVLVEGFQLETDMTLHALDKRFRIVEVPIDFVDRPEGSFSKLNTFSDGFRVLMTIFNIFRYYKPLQFFSVFASIFFLLGIAFGIPSIIDFIVHRYVYHLPSAVLAASLEVLSLISFVVGVILDSIEHHNKQRFELRMIDYLDQHPPHITSPQ